MFIPTAIVTCLAIVLYSIFTARVALARARYDIKAPAVAGHPIFERTLRIQQNTGEQLIILLPGLWMFSSIVSPLWGSVLGVVWIVGRIIYAVTYTREPESRVLGFVIGFAANGILVLGTLVVAAFDALRYGLS